MNNFFAKITITLLLCSSLFACNTIRGVGQDIEAAGEAIEKSAEKNKKY
ncbi:MAG: entericidin A/B family lipoprotein [Pseudomonadota bacterium]